MSNSSTNDAGSSKLPEADDKEDGISNDVTNQDGGASGGAGAITEESARDRLFEYFKTLGISTNQTEEKHEKVISSLTIEGIAEHIRELRCKNIIVMTGAGISTSAGIPDFRSPGTGLYSKLEKYNLPYPQAIFELDYFKENPDPFFLLAKELYPGNFQPTPSHRFIKLLHENGLLLRNYTQNIDGLEVVAGVPQDKIVAAHGTFMTSHCIGCEKEYSESWMKEKIFASELPICESCGGTVKPDIVFFGENLPLRFFTCMGQDFRKADLLIVMGTSLTVQPFASLINRVGDHVPRLLINKEKCGQSFFSGGFDFDGPNSYRDVALLGDCDEGCSKLSELLGWKDDLERLMEGLEIEKSQESCSEDSHPDPPEIVVNETDSS
ncbi:NAD-dependent protein deacetylase sirtuin-2-like [Clytia hemisphaerica]|uniref:Deacetylase sirtuin-type domain-containing protein n=1 Tax=Clytia hemisphaerica TaxID=252671 RepID=A0A7M5WYL9_9CNID